MCRKRSSDVQTDSSVHDTLTHNRNQSINTVEENELISGSLSQGQSESTQRLIETTESDLKNHQGLTSQSSSLGYQKSSIMRHFSSQDQHLASQSS